MVEAVRSMVPTSLQVRLALACPALKPPRDWLIAVALPRPGSGLLDARVTVAALGDSWPKLGVAAGVAHWLRAVTVTLKGVPAVRGAAGMPFRRKLLGAAMKVLPDTAAKESPLSPVALLRNSSDRGQADPRPGK